MLSGHRLHRSVLAVASIATTALLFAALDRVDAQTNAPTPRQLATQCGGGDLTACETFAHLARGRLALRTTDQHAVRTALCEGCKRGSGPACGLAFDLLYAGQWGATASPAEAVRYAHAVCELGDVPACVGQLILHMDGVYDHAPSILRSRYGVHSSVAIE